MITVKDGRYVIGGQEDPPRSPFQRGERDTPLTPVMGDAGLPLAAKPLASDTPITEPAKEHTPIDYLTWEGLSEDGPSAVIDWIRSIDPGNYAVIDPRDGTLVVSSGKGNLGRKIIRSKDGGLELDSEVRNYGRILIDKAYTLPHGKKGFRKASPDWYKDTYYTKPW